MFSVLRRSWDVILYLYVFDFDRAADNSPFDRIALTFTGGGYFDYRFEVTLVESREDRSVFNLQTEAISFALMPPTQPEWISGFFDVHKVWVGSWVAVLTQTNLNSRAKTHTHRGK